MHTLVQTPAELFCPSDNVDHNAVWPANVIAGTRIEGRFCKPGWSGIVGRDCLANGQWSFNVTGDCKGRAALGFSVPNLVRVAVSLT